MRTRPSSETDPRPVLVCGVGSLGSHCIGALHNYGVRVRALDIAPLSRGHALPEVALGELSFFEGDCRYSQVLEHAGIATCRAILLVTGDPHVNIEGALAARRAHPSIRIVARTGRENINELLATLLGNFVAFEPNRLAGGPFALAALSTEVLGYFRVEGRLQRILRHRVREGDAWLGRPAGDISVRGATVVRHIALSSDRVDKLSEHPGAILPLLGTGADARVEASKIEVPVTSTSVARRGDQDIFVIPDPHRPLALGDELLLLVDEDAALVERETTAPKATAHVDVLASLRDTPRRIAPKGRTGIVVLGAFLTMVGAVSVAMLVFPANDPTLSRTDAFFSALVLMTGGTYADLFPAFNHLSDALRGFSVLLSILGTVAVGLLYAWLTEKIMTARLRLPPRRPAPRTGHVLVVGLGEAGRQTVDVVHALGRDVAAVEVQAVDGHTPHHLAVVQGSGTDRSTLEAGGVAGARGVVVATDSDWSNLEIALLSRKLNPDCELVMRTRDTRFSENVAAILPNLRVICVPVLAARAFAIAALGEKVLDLFRVDERTAYVVEYLVESGDGLDGRSLTDIAEGYAVVPVLYESPGHAQRFCSSVDATHHVKAGDRVILFGLSESLQRLELGEMREPTVELQLRSLLPHASPLEVARQLAKHRAIALDEAHAMLASLPTTLPERLYPEHAYRLQKALAGAGALVVTTGGQSTS